MTKQDFKVGQKVFLKIIEGSRKHRDVGKSNNIEDLIVETVVIKIGRKYIITNENGRAGQKWNNYKFDITENFSQVYDCGTADYILFITKQDIYDYVESEKIYDNVKVYFNSWRNNGDLSLTQLKTIQNIIF